MLVFPLQLSNVKVVLVEVSALVLVVEIASQQVLSHWALKTRHKFCDEIR